MTINLFSLLIEDIKLNPSCFAGQVIVVTGAGQGIGLQIARSFALLGGKVILAELSEAGQDAHYGAVSVLINNAIYIRESAVMDMPVEIWDRTIAVNLRGTFLTCQAFLPDMLRQRFGTILNLVSTDAMPGLAAYIASKQGIAGFSQSLAHEVGEAGIHVIPFSPGMVDTPGIRSVAEGLAPRLGLQPEQFLNLSLNSAYTGLMPAEHAAAAAVYLTLHLADEFHGQVVNGYEILERAGLLHSPADVPEISEAHAKAGVVERSDLIRQLVNILIETEEEFNRLPIFVRPIARQGFKTKTGQSLADWKRLLSALEAGPTPISLNLSEMLEKLVNYYREVPRETSRFTRDEETLRQVADLSSQRIGVIQELHQFIE
jgi:NAD(P)-dependent dehydrogenase (short-subunit alcohol dehydrogenase family)